MSDTYRDKEGRECARLESADTECCYYWRRWAITHVCGKFWSAWNHGDRQIHAPTLSELRRKLVEEDGR